MSLLGARQALEYCLFMAFLGLARALPHGAARRFGAALGGVAHRLDARHRKVALANLAGAFPELDEGARRRIARRCFHHIGSMAFDRLSASRFDAVQICRRMTLHGWEHLLRAEREGRGVLLLTGHIGYWEMVADPVAIYRGEGHIIARPADNHRLNRQMNRLRTRFGNVIVPRRGAGRKAMRALKNGERVWILADQRVHPHEGIELPFLGRPAMTSTLAARLALRHGTPAVPVFCYPEPHGRYRFEVRPPIRPEGSGAEAVAALTSRYVAATEEEIRRHPEMWLWMHNRWRQRRRPGTSGGAGR
jgi:KDO2-lipid IV(A) lauroyltransferase